MRVFSILAAVAAAGTILTSTALGVPYASGVSVSGADLSFTLNQDAQNVTLMLEGGGTMDLGALAKGAHNVNVPNVGNHQIKVTNSAAAAWTQVSVDDSLTSFYSPAGVAINRNPASPNFGSIYVSNAVGGTASAGPTTAEGIYRLKSDLQPINNGTAGVTWGGSSGPWKCVVGQDDNLYVADLSNDLAFEVAPDLSGNVQLIDASNRTTGQWVGSIHVSGTKADGNRKIYLTNNHYLDARVGVIGYDLGAAAAVASGDTGTQVVGPSYFAFYPQDAIMDSSGNWYTGQYRFDPAQGAAIAKFAAGTLPLNTAAWETPKAAPYNGSYAIDVYEPNGWVAYGNYYDGFVHIFDMDDGSYIGGFDAGNRMRDIAFDAAGNIYTVDNSTEWLRVWSPGGDTAMNTPFTVVPEPASLVLLVAGGLALVRRRR